MRGVEVEVEVGLQIKPLMTAVKNHNEWMDG